MLIYGSKPGNATSKLTFVQKPGCVGPKKIAERCFLPPFFFLFWRNKKEKDVDLKRSRLAKHFGRIFRDTKFFSFIGIVKYFYCTISCKGRYAE